jgi:hypothetical protein
VFLDDWRRECALEGNGLLDLLLIVEFSGLNEKVRRFLAHEWCVLFHRSRAMNRGLDDIHDLNGHAPEKGSESTYIFESARLFFVWLAEKHIHPLAVKEVDVITFLQRTSSVKPTGDRRAQLVALIEISSVYQFLMGLRHQGLEAEVGDLSPRTIIAILNRPLPQKKRVFDNPETFPSSAPLVPTTPALLQPVFRGSSIQHAEPLDTGSCPGL